MASSRCPVVQQLSSYPASTIRAAEPSASRPPLLAERDDQVQVRGHAEHVVDRLVRAEPMVNTRPASIGSHTHRSVDQLPCRPFRFKAKRAGTASGHAAVQRGVVRCRLAQWAGGQDSRRSLGRIERFGHGSTLCRGQRA